MVQIITLIAIGAIENVVSRIAHIFRCEMHVLLVQAYKDLCLGVWFVLVYRLRISLALVNVLFHSLC